MTPDTKRWIVFPLNLLLLALCFPFWAVEFVARWISKVAMWIATFAEWINPMESKSPKWYKAIVEWVEK
ncbi:TMhelix containing protein [Vibrio phage 1.248.O._10N.261.54.F1]|nr:TMhelix containing protein [Vibrio phage 1.248.O._10N.261.54.F1]